MDRRDFVKSSLLVAFGASGARIVSGQPAPDEQRKKTLGTVVEPQQRIAIVGETQVAVVGGGIAGVAAAVAAARLGAKVALFEKATLPGGLATLGNVVIYLPICDGYGNQVSGGLCEELLRLSVRHRPGAIPSCWQEQADAATRAKHRFRVGFNPWDFALDMEELMVKEGVEIWYDTRFCDVLRGEDGIEYLLLENKSGRIAMRVDTVVDASGDADVCARAGAPTAKLAGNVRAGWFFASDGKRVHPVMLSKGFTQTGEPNPRDPQSYDGTDGRDVTKQLLGSRQMQRERLEAMRKKNAKVEPANLNTIADFRMTRRLDGALVLKEQYSGKWYEDTVGFFANWRKKGPIYPVPYRTLYASNVPNLIAAGRCISSTGRAWDQARAIPACAVTGEAAGTAAALCLKEGLKSFAALAVGRLQETLRQRGGILDPTVSALVGKRKTVVDHSVNPKAH